MIHVYSMCAMYGLQSPHNIYCTNTTNNEWNFNYIDKALNNIFID